MPVVDYKEALGLDSDPFESDFDEPWPGLVQLGQLVIHELEFTASLAYLFGAPGSGRTTLATWISRQLQYSHEVLSFDGEQGDTPKSVAHKLNDWLLLPEPAGASSIEWFAESAAVVREQKAPQVLLVVDNIERINRAELEEWLGALFQLGMLQTGALKILLLGRDSALPMPEQLRPSVFVASLPVAETQEVYAWLNRRFLSAGAAADVFTHDATTPLWLNSDGSFTRLLELAKVRALKLGDKFQAAPSNTRKSTALPVPHMISAAVLLAGLSVIFMYGGEREETKSQMRNELVVGSYSSVSSVEHSVAASSIASSTASSSAVSLVALAVPSGFSSSQADLGRSETDGSQQKSVPSVGELPGIVASEVSGGSESAQILPRRFDVVRPARLKFSEHELEVLAWPPEYYTLQLLGVSDYDSAANYIATQENKAMLYIVRSLRKGKSWFVVLAGMYPSRQEANAAMVNLPEQQRKAGPWLRSLGDVQKQVENR